MGNFCFVGFNSAFLSISDLLLVNSREHFIRQQMANVEMCPAAVAPFVAQLLKKYKDDRFSTLLFSKNHQKLQGFYAKILVSNLSHTCL